MNDPTDDRVQVLVALRETLDMVQMAGDLTEKQALVIVALRGTLDLARQGRLTPDDASAVCAIVRAALAAVQPPCHHTLGVAVVDVCREIAAALRGALELWRLQRGGATRH